MMISLTIDGRKVEVEEGTTVLEAAEDLGIKIPTLCYHKALTPYGACRMCLVEITLGKITKIQASCTYPVQNTMVVHTDTERVMKNRKIMAELHLARCPDSEEIQNLAAELGISETRIKKKDKDCTLCGLCVRMCRERMGQEVVNFINRGSEREVEPPFGVPTDICQTCGACAFICPTGRINLSEISTHEARPIPYEHNEGLISRSAIYIPYPQAVPNRATIDERYCVHMRRDKCRICEEICTADAIDYEQKEKTVDINVGSVILSPGYSVFDANNKLDYSYSYSKNVLSAIEFERILSASGPYLGKVIRPSDGKHPKRIAFVQCVGSRDDENNYCSSVCCMYATKGAIIAKEHAGEELECHIYFMDLRAFGKGFDSYYERAKELGVKYIRCRPSTVEEIPGTGNLKIGYITEDEKMDFQEYDMVVLSVGLTPPDGAGTISSIFGIDLNEYGFCRTLPFEPVRSIREGVYVCGPFTEPKDIPETVMQASSAASKTLTLLSEVKGSMITHKEYPPEINVDGQPPRIGVFVCHCGTNIAGVVNITEVVEYARTLPDVVYVENNLYTCSNDTQERIKEMISEHNLNRVIVASCTPRTHEPLFQSTIREAGLNPYLFEMANIRDQCSWVHMHKPEKATAKSKDLVRMAVAKARLIEPLKRKLAPVNPSVLVIGGGAGGMVAALELAGSGFETHLVEKEKELGGNLKRIHFLLDGSSNPQKYLRELVKRVSENKNIHLYLNRRVSGVEGSIGNFKTVIESVGGKEQNKETRIEINHGVVIVATGGKEYTPVEYMYDQDKRVVTQLELESMLVSGELKNIISDEKASKKAKKQKSKNVVMIQCVGSRDENHPYCSRVCCAEAVKNALKIKEISPQTNIFILYRDIRTYGFQESYYRKAREMGVFFIRYDEDRKPKVERNQVANGDSQKELKVSIFDPVLQREVDIVSDLVVLSVGTIPYEENKDLSQILKVPLNADDFFLEAHMKLRPVDFSTDGVFLCGLAHSAKSLEESIIQAGAAAARASTILSKDKIELEAIVTSVDEEVCAACGICVSVCSYDAPEIITVRGKRISRINEALCKSCGACASACPSGAAQQLGFRAKQLSEMVSAALE